MNDVRTVEFHSIFEFIGAGLNAIDYSFHHYSLYVLGACLVSRAALRFSDELIVRVMVQFGNSEMKQHLPLFVR
jgi:hypothetical protein